jgi:hypothetical protein
MRPLFDLNEMCDSHTGSRECRVMEHHTDTSVTSDLIASFELRYSRETAVTLAHNLAPTRARILRRLDVHREGGAESHGNVPQMAGRQAPREPAGH